jgi:hypothetical protein
LNKLLQFISGKEKGADVQPLSLYAALHDYFMHPLIVAYNVAAIPRSPAAARFTFIHRYPAVRIDERAFFSYTPETITTVGAIRRKNDFISE